MYDAFAVLYGCIRFRYNVTFIWTLTRMYRQGIARLLVESQGVSCERYMMELLISKKPLTSKVEIHCQVLTPIKTLQIHHFRNCKDCSDHTSTRVRNPYAFSGSNFLSRELNAINVRLIMSSLSLFLLLFCFFQQRLISPWAEKNVSYCILSAKIILP